MPLRIAWVGGGVGKDGGVGGIAFLLLEGLLDCGAHVEFFAIGEDANALKLVRNSRNLRLRQISTSWQWGRWYSRNRLTAFVSSLYARILAHGRMVQKLRQRHAEQPFDVIFQMSQTELFTLGKYLEELPPVVIFPCVHAAGELRWHRRESRYARQAENGFLHALVRLYLIYRAKVQARELRKPAMVIGMSHRFNELVREDAGVDASRQAVVYNPIEPAMQNSSRPEAKDSGRPIRMLCVSRISQRKGHELLVELSHRLDDMAGKVELHVIGGHTMWSDYRRHMNELNPKIAKYLGGLPHDAVMKAYDEADLLVLPSRYEPGGIVVGEALSRGLPVVVSDEVGTAEPVQGDCCRRFASGNIAEFESQVRAMIADLLRDPRTLRDCARQQAGEHFAPAKTAADLFAILENVAARRKPSALDRPLPEYSVASEMA